MRRLARGLAVLASAMIVAVAAAVISVIVGAGWEDEEHDEAEMAPLLPDPDDDEEF